MYRIIHAAAVAALFALPVSAAPVLTQDEAAFAAATAGLSFSTENFDGLADDVGLTSKDFGAFTVTSPFIFSVYDAIFCRSGACISGIFESAKLSLDSPISALGFYLGDGNGASSNVIVGGADIGSISTPSFGYTFVGIYDTTGTFTEVEIALEFEAFDIDDLSWASPSTTGVIPLPASLPLLAAGAALLGLLRRRA